MKIKARIFFLLLIAPLAALADQSEITVSRLYLVNPDALDVKNSINALEAAFKSRDLSPSKQIGLMPSELPDRPSLPESRPFNFGPVSMNVLGCGNSSYAQFGTANATNGGLIGNSSERIFGCIYLSKRGIRMSVIIEQKTSSSGSLMASLMSGIKKATRGNDADYSKKVFDSMLKEVRDKLPGVLVELEELPSGDVTRPDEERIKALALDSPLAEPPASKTVIADAPVHLSSGVIEKQPSTPEQRIQQLKSLNELRQSGILTEQEFQIEKQKILNN